MLMVCFVGLCRSKYWVAPASSSHLFTNSTIVPTVILIKYFNRIMNRSVEDLESEEDTLLMHTLHTLPDNCKKFWSRRYQLFSLYDQGIYMTSELWFSVTPERSAKFTAKLVESFIPDAQDILDICCGGGGNTIQFAAIFPRVGAIDIKQINIDCTIHNAGIYGVDSNVWWQTGDWISLSQNRDWIPSDIRDRPYPFDFVFCSPPWGGTGYTKAPNSFGLDDLQPLSFTFLCQTISKISENFGLFLPKSAKFSDIQEMSVKLFGENAKTRVIFLTEGGNTKGIMVFMGPKFHRELKLEEIIAQIDG